MSTDRLDEIDRQLIGLLRQNARTPVARLAQQVGVSRATIQNRMSRMEKQGVITGYTALIASGANEELSQIRALTHLELEGNVSKRVRSQLMREPAVSAIHTTNGRWDLVVELQTASLEKFDKALGRIRSIDGIAGSETSLLLSSHRIGSERL